MTPYGIIYTDNAYSFEQSVSIWQKKFGVMKISLLLKISLILCLILAVVYFAAGYLLKDRMYFYFYIIQCAVTVAVVYSVMRMTNIKALASQCMQKTDLQLVLYEDRLILTTPYSKSEYYYDEIIYCGEKNGCITIIIDQSVAPVSIQRESVKTGSYATVCEILTNVMKEKFLQAGR